MSDEQELEQPKAWYDTFNNCIYTTESQVRMAIAGGNSVYPMYVDYSNPDDIEEPFTDEDDIEVLDNAVKTIVRLSRTTDYGYLQDYSYTMPAKELYEICALLCMFAEVFDDYNFKESVIMAETELDMAHVIQPSKKSIH